MFKYFINKYFTKPKIKSVGNNNCVSISKSAYCRKVRLYIYGNNNSIFIDDGVCLHNVKIQIGFGDCHINNCSVRIGRNTSANGLFIQLGESGSEVIIGDNCMISFDVEISCTDTHSIFDLEDNLLNVGKFIRIGSSVWLCKDVTVLKNTEIPNNCIVAQNSTVTKCFKTPNCIIAGNPAREVKEGIKWSVKRPEWGRREK